MSEQDGSRFLLATVVNVRKMRDRFIFEVLSPLSVVGSHLNSSITQPKPYNNPYQHTAVSGSGDKRTGKA